MPTPLPDIGRAIRNIRRAREILQVLAEYGFHDVIHELGLDRVFFESRRLFGLTPRTAEHEPEPQAVRLRKAMERLGPTFIKMAQILATRRDLIPEAWAEEFAKLQDNVPALPAEEIGPHIERLYGGKIGEHFAEVDFTAFAAASIAQAHRARLHDGTRVMLKVLKPGTEATLDADTEILRTLAAFAEERFSGFGYSPSAVVEQFDRQVKREIDLKLEARSIERLTRAFSDDPRIGFPRVYREHTREGVLCLEFVEGVLLSRAEEADLPAATRRAVVAAGADAVFRQCFEIGFFHADPHPGNLFAVTDAAAPEGVRLVFIDLGMTGHIEPRSRELLADLVQGTIQGELDRVIEVVVELTDSLPSIAGDRAFRADVWEFISRFQSGSIADLQMGALLEEFFSKIRRHRLECPADIVYLIKAIGTIEGVGEQIDPGFDVVSHVRPHVERLVMGRYGFGAVRRRVTAMSLGYAELMEQLPRDLRDILRMVRRDKLVVKLEHRGVDGLTKELERASQNISHALVVSALILCGAILFLADAAAGEGWGVLTIAGAGALTLALALVVMRVIRQRIM